MLKRFLDAILFTEIVKAMKLTFKHMFHKPVTFQYPREKRVIPDAHRGALGLLRYEDGVERCVGCDLCEVACPSHCIRVVSEEHPEKPLQRWAPEFYIDITKCVFCGYCVEACPVNALAMTKMYEYSTDNKRDLIFDKDKLYEVGDRHMEDAKKYLISHNQEAENEYYKQYHYNFPFPQAEKKEPSSE